MTDTNEAVPSALPAGPAKLIAALAAARIQFRVSSEQPDGVTPIYVAAPIAAIRRLIPPGAAINGETVNFWDEWVSVFCNSPADAGP